jgi:hypothetical protein
METTSSIDYVVQLSAQVAGDAPVRGGRISFPVSVSGVVPTRDGIISKRIRYADLEPFAAGLYPYKIYLGEDYYFAGTQNPLLDNAGEPILNIFNASFLYIQSNRDVTSIDAAFPIPPSLDAGDFILHKGNYAVSVAFVDDVVLSLNWSVADIDADPDGFYCDLILAPANS